MRAGQRLHQGKPIPDTAVVHERRGRSFYISAIIDTHTTSSTVRIRYIDNGEFETIGYNEAKNYGAFCREIIKIKKK